MTLLKRIAASALDGIRWLLLAAASLSTWLGDLAGEAAERLRR